MMEVILREDTHGIDTAVPFGDGRILYSKGFPSNMGFTLHKDKECALALIDPLTKNEEIIVKETFSINTAVPFGEGKILYAGNFIHDEYEMRPLVLMDLITKESEIITEENYCINSAVPFSYKN